MNNKEVTLRDYARMCAYFEHGCDGCPINSMRKYVSCVTCIKKYTDEAEQVIRKWCEEHPKDSYLNDFCGKFPNKKSRLRTDIYDGLCVDSVYGTNFFDTCTHDCKKCWNQEYKSD